MDNSNMAGMGQGGGPASSPSGAQAFGDSSSSSGGGSTHHMSMAMQMWFYASLKVTLWFKEWKIDSELWYSISIVGLFVLCLLQEALARFRVRLTQRHRERGFASLSEDGSGHPPPLTAPLFATRLGMRVLVALLYALNVGTSYLLMLAIMTYNVGYFIAIVAGLGVGYFLFLDLGPGGSQLSEACCPQPL